MKVSEVYEKYMTPQSLQSHLLWVAALAQVLLNNWKGEQVDKDAIITCCLFHDIAKPISFDLTQQAQYGMTEKDIQKLQELQRYIKSNYGENEHHAAVMICKEIGLTDTAVTLVDNLEWEYIPRWIEKNDIASLIPIYCDMRIGPKGILPLEVRIKELYKRVGGENYEVDMKNGNTLEQKIIENITIDVNSILTTQLDKRVNALQNLEIG